MSDKQVNPLFPEILKGRLSLLLSVMFPSVLAVGVNALAFWLLWDEMKTASQHNHAWTLLMTSLLPALVSIPFFFRRTVLPTWAQALLGLSCIVHLVAFCYLASSAIPSDTPEWMVGPSFWLIQFATMTPGLFLGLWRVASIRTRFAPLQDFTVSLIVSIVGPGLLYVFLTVTMFGFRHVRSSSLEWLWSSLLNVFMIICPVFFFLGLLRCLMWVRRFVEQKSLQYRPLQLLYVALVALVFPISGLVLNIAIPFPADFQNPWPYLLTLFNAAALMIPTTRIAWVDALTRFLRWALMPFTFYFFIVFLPFMPFSLFAIIAMGAGFLILAPTLLFFVQLQELRKDNDTWMAAGVSARGRFLRALGMLAILPLCFLARSEYDRYVLHSTLDYYYAREDMKDAQSPVSARDVKRILNRVRAFRDGSEIPYLTNYYNWRVFDNLLLQEEKFNDLWRAFVDEYPPEKEKEDFSRNMFAGMFGGRTRDPGSRWGSRFRPPRNVALTEVTTSFSATNGETHAWIRLSLTSHEKQQAEYEANIEVPAAAVVAGLRLKIGTNWVDARIVERKAAEWVYRSIRDVRRDPAFLRYEGENLLKLSVFPIEPEETRQVEMLIVYPAGFARTVRIGDRPVCIPVDGDEQGNIKFFAYAPGVLVTQKIRYLEEPVWHAEGASVILDCSKGQGWDGASLAAALRRVRDEMKLPIRSILFANFETKFLTVAEQDPALLAAQCLREMLPERGGLDMDIALRRAACTTALSFTKDPSTWRVPELVLLRNHVKTPPPAKSGRARAADLKGKEPVPCSAPKVKPNTFRAAQQWLPMLSETLAVIVSEKPVSTEVLCESKTTFDRTQLIPVSIGSQIRWIPADGSRACFFWDVTGDQSVLPAVWDTKSSSFSEIPAVSRMPQESVWAKGAEAWRLQTRYQQLPHLEDLRRDILKQSWSCGVITDVGSYIAVENSAQWKMLELKQRQTLAANAALDTVGVPAPSMVLLLVGLGVFLAGCKLYKRTFSNERSVLR